MKRSRSLATIIAAILGVLIFLLVLMCTRTTGQTIESSTPPTIPASEYPVGVQKPEIPEFEPYLEETPEPVPEMVVPDDAEPYPYESMLKAQMSEDWHLSAPVYVENDVPEPEVLTPYYQATEEELLMLYRLVWLEGGHTSYECKLAIISTVFNMLEDGGYGEDLYHVIMNGNNFSVAKLLGTVDPYSCPDYPYYEKSWEFIGAWDTTIDAVDYVVLNGPTDPCICFRTGHYHKWANPYKCISGVYFGTKKGA